VEVPAPSAAQRREFAAHVCSAHSWYRHLSFARGGQFVVFLAADAGTGYSATAPRMHYSWKTTREYRRRFGHLDYLWRDAADGRFARDAGDPPRLPDEVWSCCTFTLYPYASADANAIEAIGYRTHEEDLHVVYGDATRTDRTLIREWEVAFRVTEQSFSEMSEPDQELFFDLREGGAHPAGIPNRVSTAVESDRRCAAVYHKLQSAEQAKVTRAINAFCAWAFPAQSRQAGADPDADRQ
jgi:hypothetical protein